jgi:hypothetical protein
MLNLVQIGLQKPGKNVVKKEFMMVVETMYRNGDV